MDYPILSRRVFALTLAAAASSPIVVAAQASTPIASPEICIEIEGDGDCLPVAPESDRVDLAEPSFSNPTTITHPLFPISALAQVIQLGTDAGESLRVEATLLPETKTIAWNGQQVETAVSQFIAYLDGRVVEVATDFYAQADDGAVWYFGEDVFNYEGGVVADTEGTWLAGADGPPGMIMPGKPQTGDVYRPENIPGFVFEEVTVKAVDQTVDGPHGPVEGAIVIQELLMDGTLEEKMFAPGYGEFSAKTDTEFIIVALAVPVDTQAGPVPTALSTLATGSAAVFDAALAGDWDAMSASMTEMTIAWDTYDSGDLPQALATQMDAAFDALATAIDDRAVDDARQAAIEVGRANLDFQLQHRRLADVDLARLALLTDQIELDSLASDAGAVAGDVVVAETIWARLAHTMAPGIAAQVDTHLDALRAAADDGDLTNANEQATELRDVLAGI